MTTSGKLEQTNGVSSDPVLASAKSNTLQSDDRLATSAANQECNHQMDIPEEPLNNQPNKEHIQIKQLQDRIEKLEEQFIQHQAQIKILEDKVVSK
jgi:TolA-binding protein